MSHTPHCAPSSALPAEDQSFQPLIAASASHTSAGRVEVRVHDVLSRREPQQPIQFGVFALCDFAVGDDVTAYGGILRTEHDFPAHVSRDAKSHARKLRDGFVLDGLPLANMLDRPIPSQV